MSNVNKPSFDPNLRLAIEDVKAVLKRHKVAGFVLLGSETHQEFIFEVDAPWNLLQVERSGVNDYRMRLKFKGKADEEKKRAIDATIGFMFGLRDIMYRQLQTLHQFCGQLENQAQVDHVPQEITNEGRPQ